MILSSFLVIWNTVGDSREEPSPLAIGLALALAFFLLVVAPIIGLAQSIGKLPPRKIKPRYKLYLAEIPLYRHLNPKGKQRFEKRVQYFINQKQFIPRSKGLVIDDRKKALIAGTAVELTFGFARFNFDHFQRILIYRDNYYSKISQQYHQGEVNIRGLIVLSWTNFEKGNADREDGINLGVHEIAHALKLENKIINRDHSFIQPKDYKDFQMAYKSFIEGYGNAHGFLRDYAKTNIHEFFAVCCENFIERPKEFQSKVPALYRLMVRILRQDPASIY